MATDELTPERAVRLLRAKAHELEAQLLPEPTSGFDQRLRYLAADIALVAGIVADHIEHWQLLAEHATVLDERVTDLEQILVDYGVLDPGIDPPVVDVPGPDTYEPAR